MRHMLLGGAAAILLLADPRPAGAGETPVAELPRKILGFYDRRSIGGDFKDPFFTELHQRAEMPLNFLGMDLVLRDIAEPLPAPGSLADYRGIVTWFGQRDPFADPRPFCRWLNAAMDAGLKVAMLGQLGLYTRGSPEDAAPPEECLSVLKRLGASIEPPRRQPDPVYLSVAAKDSGMVEFERKLDMEEVDELPVVSPLRATTTYLEIRLEQAPPLTSRPVLTSASGGLALDPFVGYSNREVDPAQWRWRLNPFAFFEAAFGLRGWPRPDVTTLNGRRLYFSHLDGDGFFNVSEVDKRSWSAEIFLREVLEKQPDSPFTMSVITGYYDLPRYGRRDALDLTRNILGRGNVEAASHGYAHPLIWHKQTLALDIPGYRFDARKEILDSTDFINRRLLAPPKRAALFLWTGNALPRESELGLASSGTVVNMNGGGSRFDRYYPSCGYVFPIGRRLGAGLQVYSGSANENVYTGLWQGPYYGYRDVIETFDRTGSPRRLKPVDVYVHYYSAEKIAALKVLKDVYAWARRAPLLPVFAGQYAAIARDFYQMKLSKPSPERVRTEGGLAVRTVRFDGETRVPDLAVSRGVIGFRRENGSLYVFLDESPVREIALSPRAPNVPYLVESNFEVLGWRRSGAGVAFAKRGWWTGQMTLGGLAPGKAYRVVSGTFDRKASAGTDGQLSVDFPDSEGSGPPRPVRVEPL